MLRCPPSVVTLTTADVIDMERRMAARNYDRDTSGPHLDSAPVRVTETRVVPPDGNLDVQTVELPTTTATVCDDDQSISLPHLARSTDAVTIGKMGSLASMQGKDPTEGQPFSKSDVAEQILLPLPVHSKSSLDPGASSFVPRTVFGAASSVCAENNLPNPLPGLRFGSLDRIVSLSNLEPRSSLRQTSRNQDRVLSFLEDDERNFSVILNGLETFNISRPGSENTSCTHRRAVRRTLPIVERRPILQAQHRRTLARHSSGTRISITIPRRRSARTRFDGNDRRSYIRQVARRQSKGQRRRPRFREQGFHTAERRVVSLAASSSTRPATNPPAPIMTKPQFPKRISSLSWRSYEVGSYHEPTSRLASELNTGASSPDADSRLRGLDAAEEFLRMRNSPLDELTQQLIRMSATSQFRPEGLPYENTATRGRIPLLNGDPFRQEASHESSDDEPHDSAVFLNFAEPSDTASKWPYDSQQESLALPMYSPRIKVNNPSQDIPKTPPVPLSGFGSGKVQASPNHKSFHPIATITQSVKSVKALVRTKVHVYDDSKSPAMQPQTPADILYDTRQAAASVQPITAADGLNGQHEPSPVPPARFQNRHTYPISQALAHERQVHGGLTPERTSVLQHVPRRERSRARLSGRNSSEENGLAADLVGVIDERRIFGPNREHATLETTPPREGRFERYLR